MNLNFLIELIIKILIYYIIFCGLKNFFFYFIEYIKLLKYSKEIKQKYNKSVREIENKIKNKFNNKIREFNLQIKKEYRLNSDINIKFRFSCFSTYGINGIVGGNSVGKSTINFTVNWLDKFLLNDERWNNVFVFTIGHELGHKMNEPSPAFGVCK